MGLIKKIISGDKVEKENINRIKAGSTCLVCLFFYIYFYCDKEMRTKINHPITRMTQSFDYAVQLFERGRCKVKF